MVELEFHNPKISVVMPVYKGDEYLSEAVDSILNQTFSDFEFIIICDNPTNETKDILEKYQQSDSRIHVYYQERQGLVKSLNMGLEFARGKYIARMDADDISLPERLQIQYDFLETKPNIGLCGTWIENFGQKSGIHQLPITNEDIKSKIFFGYAIAHPSVMIRKEIIDGAGGYNSHFNYIEDYELWTRICDITEVYNIPKILLQRRVHGGNITIGKQEKQFRLMREVHRRLILKIGINPTEYEQNLHEYIYKGQLSNLYSLDDAESWLLKIILANKGKRIYPEPAFSRTVEKYFYQTIMNLNSSLYGKYKKIIFSQIYKEAKYSPIPIIKRLARLTIFNVKKVFYQKLG